jgi:uncharacterized membrane protein YhaH (DUF805 family)
MPDELDTNQSPEQSVEQSPVTSTPNTDKINEISEFYQEKKTTMNESTAEPIIERSPIDYYIGAFRKYADFSGRATRSEYWWFYLVTIAVSILISILESILNIPFGLISVIYFLMSLIPNLSIQVRRLHDVDKSGWYILLNFVFIIGWIWLLILNIQDSTPGANKYGPNPKGIES